MNLMVVVRMLRPGQWVKNALLFFPPFLAGSFFKQETLIAGLLPFMTLCLASSCVYVCNDYLDREQDRFHPGKSRRPVAAGEIGLRGVIGIISGILLFLIPLALTQPLTEQAFLLGYLFLSLLYVLKLRNQPLIDMFCIAALFLLRLNYGGVIFAVSVSSWLFLTVLFLSLFLSAGKRLNECIELASMATVHRRSLEGYPDGFLAGTMSLTGAAVLVTYAVYCVSRPLLVYTVPLCCFGLFRILLRTQAGKGGDPTESLFKDGWLFFVGLIWVVVVGLSIYR